jgi:uncharacterized protein with NAD-binding domain and iron-sulfur cluster
MSAMAAALALTDLEQNNAYEVTIYQIGWRLGGQGASGRNLRIADRIEEHGLHLWFGCYDNAFSVMEAVYAELGRTEGPLKNFGEAFKGHDYCMLEEEVGGTWTPWKVEFPPNPERSGAPPTVWSYLVGIIEWIAQLIDDTLDDKTLSVMQQDSLAKRRAWWQPIVEKAGLGAHPLLGPEVFGLRQVADLLRGFVHAVGPHPIAHGPEDHEFLQWLIGEMCKITWDLVGEHVDTEARLRHFWIIFYLGATSMRGMLAEELVTRGFSVVDDRDLRQFFYQHQSLSGEDGTKAADLSYQSPLMQALYDAAFAYQDGDPAKPSMAAGTSLRISLRLLLDYKGHFVFEMQAAMGDTIFAPLYQVLQRRGVVFRFFHRVTQLELDDSGENLARIRISRQVSTLGDYGPLVDVKGLPCWPSEPLYDQIVEGAALEKAVLEDGANLEHYVSNWTDCGGPLVLEAGTDFDVAILSVTHACLPYVVEPRIQAKWEPMLKGIFNVQTQALQMWLKPTIEELGWSESPVIEGAYIEPFSSITDFTHLIPRESWPADNLPGNLTYTCGVLLAKPGETQPEANERAWQTAFQFCNEEIGPVFPKGTRPGDPNGLDWSKLYCLTEASGPDRLAAQYIRANIDPTEQYVLSVPTPTNVRRKAGDSGFGRLVITGTWIDTGLNISAVEVATMSGLQASRAISGYPKVVPGETDL